MSNTYILHAGIKGMRWGVRRYQNEDGSLTEAGRKRYGSNGIESAQKTKDAMPDMTERFKTKFKQKVNKETATRAVVKGAEVASKLVVASALDDLYTGGAGKRITKKAAIQTGRAVVTAYTMARGGYDIRWYDN